MVNPFRAHVECSDERPIMFSQLRDENMAPNSQQCHAYPSNAYHVLNRCVPTQPTKTLVLRRPQEWRLTLADNDRTFGERLYSQLRQLSGYHLITGIMDYETIQQLKVSDRDDTLKLFRGSSYEVIQLLKTAQPEDAARHLVAQAEEAKDNSSDFMMIMISSM